MKKFLQKIFWFSLTFICCIGLLSFVTAKYCSSVIDLKISKEKNILILGNSHPECAINDSLLPNAFNLAQSGSGYFYDLLKLKAIKTSNPHIDTLILGYSYKDLSSQMDFWFNGSERIKYKIRSHFFLFSIKDYLDLLEANTLGLLMNTPQTIYYNLNTARYGMNNLGGFKDLIRNKLEEDIERLLNEKNEISSKNFSKYQIKYLQEIYSYCLNQNITLILLNTPVHQVEQKRMLSLKDQYCKFATSQLSNAILIDHSNLTMPDTYFADLDHLNSTGAFQYTKFLKSIRLGSGVNECKKN